MRKQHFYYTLKWTPPKNGSTFFLDPHFSYYIVVKRLVAPGVFFILFNLKIVRSRLLLKISKEFGLRF